MTNILKYLKALNLVGNLASDDSGGNNFEPVSISLLDILNSDSSDGTFTIDVAESIKICGEVTELTVSEGQSASVLKLGISVEVPVVIQRISLVLDYRPTVATEHGFQSWSPIRITDIDDVRPSRDSMPDWVKGMYYSDAKAVGKVFAADQYMACKNENSFAMVGFLSTLKHFSNLTVENGNLVVNAILDGVTVEIGSFDLDPIYFSITNISGDGTHEKPDFVSPEFDRSFNFYMDLWSQYSEARSKRSFALDFSNEKKGKVDLGWCSWYQYFWDLEPSHIDDAIDEGVYRGYDLIQIDDGFQKAIGDWLEQSDNFKGELERLVSRIKENQMVPGIWTAPFLVGQNSNVFKNHPEWVVLDRNSGQPQVASMNPSWGGFAYALDTTNQEVLQFLVETYRGLSEMGFDYHKIDFCYAAALDGIRHNENNYTRAQALRMGLAAVREGIGDRYLLGCGCPFGPAVGIVDAMRVSADTAPYFEERIAWTGFNEASPSAYNALIASVLRANMNSRLFVNDPDCILLRTRETMLDQQQLDLVMAVVGGVGNFEIISDNVKLLKDEDYIRLDKIRQLTGATGPLEIRNLFSLPLVVDSAQTRLVVDLWGNSDPVQSVTPELTGDYELVISAAHQNMWAKLFKKVS